MGGWDYIDEWFLDDILLTDNPIIEMSSSEFVFNADANGLNPDDQILAIQNRGGDILNWEISETCDWLTPIPAAGSLEPNAITEVGLSVDISGLWWGNYNCQLTFSDPCAANSPKYVGVELYVREVSGILPVPSLYPTIRTAVDNSDNGDTVLVADGIYTGEGNRNIDFLGKAITVKSANGPENCIIDREYVSRAFYFNNGETSSSKIEGITILNGNQNFGSSIYINNSSPTISNCHFKDNSRFNGEGVIYCEGSSSEITNCIFDNNYMENGSGIVCKNNGNIIIKGCEFYRGGDSAIICEYGVVATIDNCIIMYTNGTADHHAPPAIWLVEAYGSINNCLIAKNNSTRWAAGIGCTRSSPSITNCTIVDNESLEDGGGIFCYDSYPIIKNCIIWNNEPPSGSQVVLVAGSDPIITHSNVQGSWAGIGNIDIDPNFVDPDNGDYHLMSQAGHWDESTESWIQDDVTSPCVDAGDPNSDYSSEPWPNGGRINMGAYGNTPEASRSCTNIDDVRLMGADWLQDDSVTDIMPLPDGDGIVDLRDYAFLFEHWLCQGN
jgi:hypothetical protein